MLALSSDDVTDVTPSEITDGMRFDVVVIERYADQNCLVSFSLDDIDLRNVVLESLSILTTLLRSNLCILTFRLLI